MNRTTTLILVVGLVFFGSVSLRIRSEMNREHVVIAPMERPAAQPPADYVANPVVAVEEMDSGPGRIISVAPSLTEILCALGMRDRLIARTPYCRYPPEVTDIETIGAIMDTNYERIKAIEPDLVLVTANSGRMIEDLQKLGIAYFAVSNETLEDLYTAIERIGERCDRPRTARALVQLIRFDIDRLSAQARASRQTPMRVLISMGNLPIPAGPVFVAGPGLFFDEMLHRAGHVNAATGAVDAYQGELPIEKLTAIDPDAIIEFRNDINDQTRQELYNAWSAPGDLRAVRDQRIFTVGAKEWLSLGPRAAILLHHMIEALSFSG